MTRAGISDAAPKRRRSTISEGIAGSPGRGRWRRVSPASPQASLATGSLISSLSGSTGVGQDCEKPVALPTGRLKSRQPLHKVCLRRLAESPKGDFAPLLPRLQSPGAPRLVMLLFSQSWPTPWPYPVGDDVRAVGTLLA